MKVYVGWGDDTYSFADTNIRTLEEFYTLLWGLDFLEDLEAGRRLIVTALSNDEDGPFIRVVLEDTTKEDKPKP